MLNGKIIRDNLKNDESKEHESRVMRADWFVRARRNGTVLPGRKLFSTVDSLVQATLLSSGVPSATSGVVNRAQITYAKIMGRRVLTRD